MLGAIFKKVGMTRVFDKEGAAHPVVVLKLDRNRIVGSRDKQKNGYAALVVGYGQKPKEKRKSVKGFYKDLAVSRGMKEFCVNNGASDEVLKDKRGAEISVGSFANVTHVDARGFSIGKGFQGVIKRHGMGGGPKSHGSHFHRAPGSIGNCADPARVFKGRKMPGQMGNKSVCIQNLKVMGLDEQEGLLWVKGSVPGSRGATVELTPSLKKQQTMEYVFVENNVEKKSGGEKAADAVADTATDTAESTQVDAQADAVEKDQKNEASTGASAEAKAGEGQGVEKSADQKDEQKDGASS